MKRNTGIDSQPDIVQDFMNSFDFSSPSTPLLGTNSRQRRNRPQARINTLQTNKTPIDMAAEITRNTPLVELTAGQLADLLQNAGQLAASTPATTPAPGRRYVYGLKGIMQLFGVSNVTAQRYKAGIIKEAVTQYGRKIVVDADKALALFKTAQDQQ